MEQGHKPSNPLAEKARSYSVRPKDQVWQKLDAKLAHKRVKRRSLKVNAIIIVAAIVIGIAAIAAVIQVTHLLGK